MSSHREAPEISKDPVADSSDLYAFVSPDAPNTVTLIANYVPLELPAGGPNFYEFGDDVLYEIHIDNDGDGDADITYQFRFTSELTDPQSFLYNTGPITSLSSTTWNRRQFYSVTRIDESGVHQLGEQIPCPPCNVGPRSIPSYGPLAAEAVTSLPSGEVVFAGQRADGFYVDLGSVFDLGDLRPFEQLHLIATPAAPGVNAVAGLNVHSIAIQLPIASLTHRGRPPSGVADPFATIGVWTSASRQRARVSGRFGDSGAYVGPWTQVSRLGNPLFNEVVVPIGMKDRWNSLPPSADGEFLSYVQHPELAALLPVLYPTAFPTLKTLSAARADLVAILLTGIPSGIVPGFQNYTGATFADMLRLNVAIGPTLSNPSIFGLLGGRRGRIPERSSGVRRRDDDRTSRDRRADLPPRHEELRPRRGGGRDLRHRRPVEDDGFRPRQRSGRPTRRTFLSRDALGRLQQPVDHPPDAEPRQPISCVTIARSPRVRLR